jgi:hypothetical protein
MTAKLLKHFGQYPTTSQVRARRERLEGQGAKYTPSRSYSNGTRTLA